jgi:hypothetical protein
MRIQALVALALLGYVSNACAETGVLVEHVPAGADRTIVMSVIRQALWRRGWTIQRTDGYAVLASINGNKTDALMTVRLDETSISYQCKATLTVASNAQQVTKPVGLPRRWLRSLQIDIGNALATLPEKPST